MKYKFELMVALTYEDKTCKVEVDLTDEEVARIKRYGEFYSPSVQKRNPDMNGYGYIPPESLLTLLEDEDEELFDKFWDVIYPVVYKEELIDGIKNGYIELDENDNFADHNKATFQQLYDLYGDCMELDHDTTCILHIPKEWIPK